MATLGGMERGPRTPPRPGARRAADPGVVAAAVTVREATRRALDVVAPLAPLEVALADARGCLLAQDVQADTPLPPVDLAAFDGYAVRAADTHLPGGHDEDGARILRVVAQVRPGDVDPASVVRGSAVRVSSGVPMPRGADAVVPADATDRGRVRVTIRAQVPAGSGVRRAGQDLAGGAVAVRAGTRLSARHLGLLAAAGLNRVRVHPRARVVVLTVGDEIVERGTHVPDGHVRDATGMAVLAALAEAGADAYRVAAVPDGRGALRDALEDQLVRADVVLVTGGLSQTGHDNVAGVLAELGRVDVLDVATEPALRVAVGTLQQQTPVFALPGHPVRALLAFETIVLPAMRRITGAVRLGRPTVTALVEGSWSSPAGRRELVCADVEGRGTADDPYRARPLAPAAEISQHALAGANALLVVPEDVTDVRDGSRLGCVLLDG